MRLLCIRDRVIDVMPGHDGTYPLIIGRYYEGKPVFYNEHNPNTKTIGGVTILDTEHRSVVEWKKNMIQLEGFSEIDWFPTSLFMTMDEVREMKLNEIGI